MAPMDIPPKTLIPAQRARPFNTSFNRQMNAARSLYGPQLQIPKFRRAEITSFLAPFLLFYPARDQGIISDRVCETILTRQRSM